MALIERSVWFFSIKVAVTGDSRQPWVRGSEAIVQCFVPGHRLEDSLVVLDEFLETQELRRLDTRQALRYDPNDEAAEYPGDYFREPLEAAAARNECVLGVFVVADETARWRDEVEPDDVGA
jgi:hypothetical protein